MNYGLSSVLELIDAFIEDDQDFFGPQPMDSQKREMQVKRAHAAFEALDRESESQDAALLALSKLEDLFSCCFRNGERWELFCTIFEEGDYPAVFWPCLHKSWGDFEGINHRRAATIFRKYRNAWSPDFLPRVDPYREQDVKAIYDSLPDEITTFRGTGEGKPLGLSWTLELPIAEKFARRIGLIFRTIPTVVKATVSKKHVASVVLREQELVLFSAQAAKKREVSHIEPHPHSTVTRRAPTN